MHCWSPQACRLIQKRPAGNKVKNTNLVISNLISTLFRIRADGVTSEAKSTGRM